MDAPKWQFVIFLAFVLILGLIAFVNLIGPNPDLSNAHPLMTIGFIPLVALILYFILADEIGEVF